MATDIRNQPTPLSLAPPQVRPAVSTAPRLRAAALRAVPFATFAAFIALWQAAIVLGNYPAYILPPPFAVARRTWQMFAAGTLQPHIVTTLMEAALGLGLAAVLAAALAYPLAHSRFARTLLAPVLAATQAVPLVAIAPLLVLWLGFGITPKVVTCALIVFFPLLLNTVAGLNSVEPSLMEAAQVFGADRRQALWYVELPLALPAILTGLKIGCTVAITGAVVGEFVTAESGLGYLLTQGRGQFDTTLVFVALFVLATIAIAAYAFVGWLEKKIVTW